VRKVVDREAAERRQPLVHLARRPDEEGKDEVVEVEASLAHERAQSSGSAQTPQTDNRKGAHAQSVRALESAAEVRLDEGVEDTPGFRSAGADQQTRSVLVARQDREAFVAAGGSLVEALRVADRNERVALRVDEEDRRV